MLKKDVQIGGHYIARISGKMTVVRIKSQWRRNKQGWTATNLRTHREIRILSATKLRRAVTKEQANQLLKM